ncbi:MAG: hypothetical protein ABSH48_03875 [Verrucomicrobiota bacterium]
MKGQIHLAGQTATTKQTSHSAKVQVDRRIWGRDLKRVLFALLLAAMAANFSGCLIVHDDEGHPHWRWYHHDDDHDH